MVSLPPGGRGPDLPRGASAPRAVRRRCASSGPAAAPPRPTTDCRSRSSSSPPSTRTRTAHEGKSSTRLRRMVPREPGRSRPVAHERDAGPGARPLPQRHGAALPEALRGVCRHLPDGRRVGRAAAVGGRGPVRPGRPGAVGAEGVVRRDDAAGRQPCCRPGPVRGGGHHVVLGRRGLLDLRRGRTRGERGDQRGVRRRGLGPLPRRRARPSRAGRRARRRRTRRSGHVVAGRTRAHPPRRRGRREPRRDVGDGRAHRRGPHRRHRRG